MKRPIFNLKIATVFVTIALLCGCMSSDQKKEDAQHPVQTARENLQAGQMNKDAVTQNTVTADELKTFKLESDLKIKNNEVSIAKLKLRMNNSGSTFDEVYARRIDSLEMKNQNMKTRMGNYDTSRNDWSKFRREFNRDLDELRITLKNLIIAHKK